MSKLQPTYKDKTKVVNKITIAPKKEDEFTFLLKDYKGPSGWAKDARLISYGMKLQEWGEISQATMLTNLATDPDFMEVADIAFNGQVDLEQFQFMDVVNAFQQAIAYRMGQADTEEVNEAKKN